MSYPVLLYYISEGMYSMPSETFKRRAARKRYVKARNRATQNEKKEKMSSEGFLSLSLLTRALLMRK